MEAAVTRHQIYLPLTSKPAALQCSTISNIQEVKLRQPVLLEVQPDPACIKPNVKKTRHSVAPVRSTTALPATARNGYANVTSSAGDLISSETKFHKSEVCALPPLKPKRIPSDLLEYAFERYLDARLLCSLVEEDKRTTKNILADEELVPQIYLYFEKREIGITRAKNSIIFLKMKDLEILDSFITTLSKLANTITSDVSSILSSLTSNLHDSVHMIPLTNCTFTFEKQDMWRNLAATAKKLSVVLLSEEKPFHFINLMDNTFKDVEEQVEHLEQNVRLKVSLERSITFLTSMRLSYLLAKKNERRMMNELSHISAEEEIQAEELKTSYNSISLIYQDNTSSSTKTAS